MALQSRSLELALKLMAGYSLKKGESNPVSPGQYSKTITLLTKICRNIFKDPANPKYRKLKLSSNAIDANIVKVLGAEEFLKALGFQRSERLLMHSGQDNRNDVQPMESMTQLPFSPLSTRSM